MIEIAWPNLGADYADRPSALTIGVFDGLHAGHRALIDRVVETEYLHVVVTFQRHPTETLLHDSIPGFVSSLRQKRHALSDLGVDVVVQIDFTDEFRLMPGREFLAALASGFRLRRLVVGHDFRCGYRLDTDIHAIRDYFADADVDVIEVAPVESGDEPVSSTRIRSLLQAGDVAEAGRLLGRPFALDVGDEEIEVDQDRAYVVMTPGGILPESRQLVPASGRYDAAIGDRDAIVVIGENSVSWPLAAGESIRYIVLKERRFSSKE